MLGKNVDIRDKTIRRIDEFRYLENFLTKSFKVLKEKNKAQEDLANCTAQVAHDIRSPLVALNTVIRDLRILELPVIRELE